MRAPLSSTNGDTGSSDFTITDDPNAAEVVKISEGQLFLVRSETVRGGRECMYVIPPKSRFPQPHALSDNRYNDAMATIRRVPSMDHTFQLVITRVYEDGNEELIEDEEESELGYQSSQRYSWVVPRAYLSSCSICHGCLRPAVHPKGSFSYHSSYTMPTLAVIITLSPSPPVSAEDGPRRLLASEFFSPVPISRPNTDTLSQLTKNASS